VWCSRQMKRSKELELRFAALALVAGAFARTAGADPISLSESTGAFLESEVGSASGATFGSNDGLSPASLMPSNDGYGGRGTDQTLSLTENQTAPFEGSFDPAVDGNDITVTGLGVANIPSSRPANSEKAYLRVGVLVTALAALAFWRLRKNLSNPEKRVRGWGLGKTSSLRGIPVLANSTDKMSEATVTCPKCGSTNVRRSSIVGFVADLFELFGRLPFRCRACRKRFYHASPPPGAEMKSITRSLP
jgi:hypothetical protein